MGTCSYVLTGTEQGMRETFGSTCHGAVSKNKPNTIINLTKKQFFFSRVEHCREQSLGEIWTIQKF